MKPYHTDTYYIIGVRHLIFRRVEVGVGLFVCLFVLFVFCLFAFLTPQMDEGFFFLTGGWSFIAISALDFESVWIVFSSLMRPLQSTVSTIPV